MLSHLFKKVGNKLTEAPTPCQPFVMSAWRNVEISFDTGFPQILD